MKNYKLNVIILGLFINLNLPPCNVLFFHEKKVQKLDTFSLLCMLYIKESMQVTKWDKFFLKSWTRIWKYLRIAIFHLEKLVFSHVDEDIYIALYL